LVYIKDMQKTDILKKTEKIASAVYLITGFFDDKEPLKWKLRTLASNLLSTSIFLKDNTPFITDRVVVDIQNTILEIDSLFVVAKRAGLVSDSNHEILSGELTKFVGSISGSSLAIESPKPSLLSKDFFASSISSTPNLTPTPEPKIQNIIKDKIEETPSIPKGHILDESVIARIGSKSESKHLRDYSVVAVKKNSRQSIIINLLKRKKEIMIKDVSSLIAGCSEKTIQRELMAMVHNGTLRKMGEKRWSKYSLA
jgi:predicted transcriptional regulator